MMRAVRLHSAGGPADLILEEIDTPHVLDEALVRVDAAAITRDELGWPTDRLPAIPSYEMSARSSPSRPASRRSAGRCRVRPDPVRSGRRRGRLRRGACCLLAARAEWIDDVVPRPCRWRAFSAWQGLLDNGHLEEGQRVLVTGERWRRAPRDADRAGAGRAWIGSTSASEEEARTWGVTGGGGRWHRGRVEPVDLVFDTAGGDMLRRSPRVVRDGGRIVSMAEDPPEIPDGEEDRDRVLRRRIEP